MRSTVTELHPQVLVQLGLTPAMRELLRQFESTPISPWKRSSMMWVSPSLRRCCTGMARELLTNVGKYPKAATIGADLDSVAIQCVLPDGHRGQHGDRDRLDFGDQDAGH